MFVSKCGHFLGQKGVDGDKSPCGDRIETAATWQLSLGRSGARGMVGWVGSEAAAGVVRSTAAATATARCLQGSWVVGGRKRQSPRRADQFCRLRWCALAGF